MCAKSPRLARRDLRRVHETWHHLGETDPFWAVLARPDKEGGAWSPEEFFATGRAEVEELLAEIGALLPGRGGALDFGCGVGRVTGPLADHFERVDGVDVAPSMVELARRHDSSDGRCRFHLHLEPDLTLFADETFDLVYSNLTLQHMPPCLARLYVAEFLRVLRPGGLAVFQLPVHWGLSSLRGTVSRVVRRCRVWLRLHAPRWIYRAYRLVVAPGQPLPPPPPEAEAEAEMEMHGIQPSRALRVLESSGGRLLELRIWGDIGDVCWDSYRYMVQRQRPVRAPR